MPIKECMAQHGLWLASCLQNMQEEGKVQTKGFSFLTIAGYKFMNNKLHTDDIAIY